MVRALAQLAAAVALAACGRTHPLQDGSYAFTRTEVVRDDCGEATRPDLMSGGALQTHGHEVRFDTGFFGIKLVGQYLSGTEEFYADGSAGNVLTTVQGRECLLDLVVLNVDGAESDPNHFAGTLTANYQANRPVDCACETWVRFSAVRQ